jgi:cell division initiation protein
VDLTPREIQDKQFHDAFRGYSHEEVDMFLDEVGLSFERVYRENQEFSHRFREMEEQLHQARATDEMLKKTLLTAQKTAEEAIEEARQKAQGMVAGAERKAQELIANAERRAQEIVGGAIDKQREIEVGLEGLKKFEGEYRARLQAFIESQLRVLEEGPVAPRPAEPQAEVAAEEPEVPRPIHVGPETPGPEMPRTEMPRPNIQEPTQPISLPEPQRVHGPATGPISQRPPPGPSGKPEDRDQPKEEEDERSIQHLFWGEE